MHHKQNNNDSRLIGWGAFAFLLRMLDLSMTWPVSLLTGVLLARA
jgi:hypothetical protein